MSIRSMTGYGHGEARGGGLRVEVEISSVNRRQLDLALHLPRPLQVLESRLQDEIGRRVSRGRLTVNVSMGRLPGGRRRAVRCDEDLADAYVRALRSLARRHRLTDDLGVSVLAALPDVLVPEHPEEDAERVWPLLRKALRGALDAVVAMREAEGRSLERDLLHRLDVLRRHVARIEARAPAVMAHHRRALLRRLKEAGVGMAADDDRLVRELAIFADRSDISEEMTRLKSHFAQAGAFLRGAEPAGRSLDFLAQEMFREINTAGNKAGDSAIAAAVVAFKAELERVREQVQNIE